MSLTQYLEEDGTGTYKQYRVRDLVPTDGSDVELLLVLESPHTDELRNGVPLAGDAGQRALRFLSPNGAPPEALGPYIATRHAAGDTRIALVNASPLPLQRSAFSRHRNPPKLSPHDFELLEVVRSSQTSTIGGLQTLAHRSVNEAILAQLEHRLAALNIAPTALIGFAGKFTHRTWASATIALPGYTVLVPHPSNGWWTRTTKAQERNDLATIATKFAALTS